MPSARNTRQATTVRETIEASRDSSTRSRGRDLLTAQAPRKAILPKGTPSEATLWQLYAPESETCRLLADDYRFKLNVVESESSNAGTPSGTLSASRM
ncbi:hypothetical protein PHLCEN_2v8017 [Hermanssonia centrifuga]|uniref:Uncharacterized protein n=1 Tax=Hermanssonia centrifuga TaxID=98765 RepID=A0A2R6NUV2_9APHY|nr:hypothetical protein PHLCEN_2v8017 [Hermanssonia centrifuga]